MLRLYSIEYTQAYDRMPHAQVILSISVSLHRLLRLLIGSTRPRCHFRQTIFCTLQLLRTATQTRSAHRDKKAAPYSSLPTPLHSPRHICCLHHPQPFSLKTTSGSDPTINYAALRHQSRAAPLSCYLHLKVLTSLLMAHLSLLLISFMQQYLWTNTPRHPSSSSATTCTFTSTEVSKRKMTTTLSS